MLTFRTLTAREIDCRVGQVFKDRGLTLLLYKDARCDQAILDETVGPMNWQRHHSRDNANCTVSIWDDDKKQWIEKEDTGTESNTEAEKGLASDSFKRSCVCWGIGRELYTAPFIWIDNRYVEYDNKGRPKTKFEVGSIGYNDHREISELTIIDSKTKDVVFTFGNRPRGAQSQARQGRATAKADNPPKADKPADKPTEAQGAAQFRCAACGNVLKPYKDGNGKDVGIREHANRSMTMFNGEVLCLSCIKRLHPEAMRRSA